MQLTIHSLFRQLFPDKIFSDISLIFSKIPDISLTAVKFPDIFLVFQTSGHPVRGPFLFSRYILNTLQCKQFRTIENQKSEKLLDPRGQEWSRMLPLNLSRS